jgi:hypothetical protein
VKPPSCILLTTVLIGALWAQPALAAPPRAVAANGQACTVIGTNGNDRLRATHARDVVCGSAATTRSPGVRAATCWTAAPATTC